MDGGTPAAEPGTGQKAEAERQPVLVAWEDLHWADPTTLEALGLVIEQVPTVPMLHVLTYRPEFGPP
jgi:predicted ATPase